MSTAERNGRILLAAAVLFIFLTFTASMIAGRLLTPFIIGAVLIGLIGAGLMYLGRRD